MSKPNYNLKKYDVVVVGAGSVGAVVALLLAKDVQLPISIAIIDPIFDEINTNKQHFEPVQQHSELGTASFWHSTSRRVSAINNHIFNTLTAQLELGPALAAIAHNMEVMRVFTPECSGNFEIYAQDYGDEPLARVVSNEGLAWVLIQALKANSRVTTIAEKVTLVRPSLDAKGYNIETNNSVIHANILIGADGSQSKVRAQLGFVPQPVAEPSIAMSAQLIMPSLCENNQALQWFLKDGSVLGLLPVKGSDSLKPYISMVWSMPAFIAKSVKSMEWTPALLLHRLVTALTQSGFISMAHNLEVLSLPKIWPLQRYWLDLKKTARDYPQLFFIGDAAHVIHPLAGQGLNLGLDDAVKLYQLIQTYYLKALDPTAMKLESSLFFARRQRAAQQMLFLCESFRVFFEKEYWPLRFASAFAFKQFDRHTILKKKIVKIMSFADR